MLCYAMYSFSHNLVGSVCMVFRIFVKAQLKDTVNFHSAVETISLSRTHAFDI